MGQGRAALEKGSGADPSFPGLARSVTRFIEREMELDEKRASVATTHRVNERELLTRLERFCESAGLEFPLEAWPRDDRKAYFLLGLCATEDMKDISLRERLTQLDSWARKRDLLKPNETLFANRKPETARVSKIQATAEPQARAHRQG
jgi:hypothetical protein